jgi:hypothetical protein
MSSEEFEQILLGTQNRGTFDTLYPLQDNALTIVDALLGVRVP